MALVRLYEVTGEQRYLDLAEYFVTERGRQPYIFDIQADENAKRDADANYKPKRHPTGTPTTRRTSRPPNKTKP